jgi:hypothetical protein
MDIEVSSHFEILQNIKLKNSILLIINESLNRRSQYRDAEYRILTRKKPRASGECRKKASSNKREKQKWRARVQQQ